MTIEERAELAVETFAAGRGNCTQSVLCAWEDKIPVDHDTLMKLGAGYGAGMGCMQATCGALIGAVMAAGSVTNGKGTPRTARSILTSFQEKSGATICKDLKGVETGKVLCPCAQCVRNAVLAAPSKDGGFIWRSRRDSNSRYAFGVHTISSRARYDRFDTAAYRCARQQK